MALVKEKKTDIIKVKDILQAVAIDKGHHKVVYVYKPSFLSGFKK